MKIFVISDTHLSHKKLVEYGRPADFEEQIIANLEKGKGDILIHCGDLWIGENERNTVRFMNAAQHFGKKILVRGNHDPQSDAWYLAHGWDFVAMGLMNTYFGKNLVFTHKPMPNNIEADFNIHGHMHGKGTESHRFQGELAKYYDPKYHKDAGVDLHGFAPVDLETLLK